MKLEVFVVLDPDTGKPFCTNQNTLFNCASGVEEVSIRFAGRFGLGAAATRKLVIKMTPQGKGTIKGYACVVKTGQNQGDLALAVFGDQKDAKTYKRQHATDTKIIPIATI